MRKFNAAVVGATGAVGSMMLKVLSESQIPLDKVVPMATSRSAGKSVIFRDRELKVENIAEADFSGIDIALFAGGEIASADFAPKAVSAGAVVIDNSATYRMDPNVPLVIPEVNAHHLDKHKGIIANPNCSTIQMVVALAPLHKAAELTRVMVATYQSVSGTGLGAIEELRSQAACFAEGKPIPAPSVYPRQIAFNLFPHIGSFGEDGFTGEETKMMTETRKIMDIPNLAIAATCARVPVFYAHSEVIHAEFARPLTPEKAREILQSAPGVKVMDGGENYPVPLDAEGQDLVLVGRIRRDPSAANGVILWAVADNLRKGAATNAVQIAQTLIDRGLLK
ncbi:MAG: aspartate-semialdehyde dehydrogenase [bacterium]|nr:aspartate-semialdehyde dehydrogenase [bacterium]